MTLPLMPKATAVWLIENTALTFQQIADFTGMHALEVQAIADGDVAAGIVGLDPVANGQLTREEIARCETDPAAHLRLAKSDVPVPQTRTKGARYTPVSKRNDRPDGIAWLLRHVPELTDAQIAKLIGSTKDTIKKVRDRSHWNSANIKPRDPVLLGLCSQSDLNAAVVIARRRTGGQPPRMDEGTEGGEPEAGAADAGANDAGADETALPADTAGEQPEGDENPPYARA
ncbi:MAG: DUF1013 domain-containing protein [Alphaproteobacteria bacterium]|nr:DUF1013 domain-containing protein [Alphaproteobacteria bacterium]